MFVLLYQYEMNIYDLKTLHMNLVLALGLYANIAYCYQMN